jgi:hypothetical protein
MMLASLQSSAFCQEEFRTWTDATGKFSLEAKLVSVSEIDGLLQAELQKRDGKFMGIPVDKLSADDQKVIQQAREKWAKEESGAKIKSTPPTDNPSVTAKSGPENKSEADRPSTKSEKKPVSNQPPETKISTRPIGAPVSMSAANLDSAYLRTDLKLDASKAIVIERVVPRNREGNPSENPTYLVEVDAEQFLTLPASIREIVQVLHDESVAIDARRRAIDRLPELWPQRRHPVLFAVLVNCMSSDDKYLRLGAMDLLASHDGDQSLPYILARVDDVAYEVRWRAFEVLTQLRDPRVIPELCERFDTVDRKKIANVLKAFGSTSTQWVIPWLESESENVLLDCCKLLGDISGKDSLEAIAQLSNHKSLLVRAQARNASRRITDRAARQAEDAKQK